MDTQDPKSVEDTGESQNEAPPVGPLEPSASVTPGAPNSGLPLRREREFLRVVFVGARGIRSGWRLSIWLVAALAAWFLLSSLITPLVRHAVARSQSLGIIFFDGVGFASVLAANVLMARIERRRLADFALPLREAFGRQFWQGVVWGLVSLSVLVGVIHLWHGFDFGSLAVSGSELADYGVLWAVAFLTVGFFEESLTRSYALFTLADGIRFWPAAGLLSGIFGAIHLGNGGESWVGAFAAALIGLFFCFTVRRTGSLWFAIGMHFSWDYAESFIYSVPDSGAMITGHLLNSSFHGPLWLTGGTVGPEASLFVFVIIAALFAVFGATHRDVRFPRRAAFQRGGPALTARGELPLNLDA
jgi:uncharacterized protein